ncbi:hypothetical protein [Brevibacillus centrosporus]|uniref:hypothetical protein n=1 Tax=Brevibacillus centrosporus TaxID=54910 RepID=UPI003B01A25A
MGGYVGYKALQKQIVESNFVKVVAVKKGHILEPYTPILDSDLTYLPVSKDYMIPGVFTDPSKLIGKQTYQRVGELSPILDWQLTDNKFLPNSVNGELQYEFPISDFAPLTVIRKGDVIGVWVKYHEPENELTPEGIEIPKEPTLFKKTNPAADLLFTTMAAGIKDGEGSEIFSLKPPKLSAQVVEQAIEVVDSGSDTQDRLAASFRGKPTKTPAKLIMNLNEKQVKILEEAKQYGDWLVGVGIAPATVKKEEGSEKK